MRVLIHKSKQYSVWIKVVLSKNHAYIHKDNFIILWWRIKKKLYSENESYLPCIFNYNTVHVYGLDMDSCSINWILIFSLMIPIPM